MFYLGYPFYFVCFYLFICEVNFTCYIHTIQNLKIKKDIN